jgi:DNA-binding NarL/FixJ family response regulator
MPEPLSVAIVEDDERLRSLYADVLSSSPDFRCVGAYGSCKAVIADLDDTFPDIILMDIGLPDVNGIEGVRIIKQRYPSIEIVMFTVYDDEDKVFRSIMAGASGYLVKNATPDEFLSTLRQIKTGSPMSAAIARRVMELVKKQAAPPSQDSFNLSSRERDILQCLVEGLSYKQIAEKLFISVQTVQSHVKRVYEKLHVHSKSEAVSKAFRFKLF